MKRIIYITILALMLLAACTKPSPAPAPAPEHFNKYIFFSHSVETKATLVEKAENIGTFGVVGFKYDSNTDWAKYSTTPVNGKLPTPNVFYDPVTDPETQQVTNELVNVETVSVDGTQTVNGNTVGIASYSPLQGWSNTKKYAFFAFYPFFKDDNNDGVNDYNVSLVNPQGGVYTDGVPAIKYTMTGPEASAEGAAVGTAFKASMIDVITADHVDQYWKSSTDNSFINKQSNDFELVFKHRLSALGVSIKNSSSGTIEIKSLTLTISGIKYLTTIIPLDGSAQTPEELAEETKVPETTFTINIAGDEKSIAAKSTEITDKLIFIPQSENEKISISLSVGYTCQYGESAASDENFEISGITTPLTEGTKHMLQLNFIDHNVYVMVVSDVWDTAPDVYHDFS